jgi:hypothetical protein
MRRTLLATLLILTGCDQLYVEAVVPELCQHLDRQQFVVPPEVRARYALLPAEVTRDLELAKTFDFDVAVQLPAELKSIDARFALTYVKITAVAPTTDFAFLTSASITLEPGASSTLTPYTMSYQRQTAAPKEILWQGDNYDLSAYLKAGDLKYSLSMVGSLPDQDVTADVDACASAAVKVNYLAQ